MLKSRLFELELQKRKEKESQINQEKKKLDGVIKLDLTYYIHIKLIKDLRTNYETSNVNDVLDGKIKNF